MSEPAIRTKSGTFAPGHSGNPEGRKKIPDHVREMARAATDKAIQALVDALDSPDERVKIAAATAVLDRGWGKPSQALAVTHENADPLNIASAREAAQEVLRDPEARKALRAALRGETVTASVTNVGPVTYPINASTSSTSPATGATSDTLDPSAYATPAAYWSDFSKLRIEEWFRHKVVARYPRVAICGGPKVGKTTLASTAYSMGRHVIHTDDYIDLVSWEEVPQTIDTAVEHLQPGEPWILEGVQAARCLRKGLVVDAVIWLDRPHVPRTAGQESMAKAVRTVFDEWRAANPAVPVLVPPV